LSASATRLGLSGSSQFRIFLFGFCQDWNLEFRILPKFKEGLVGSSCLDQVALHRIGAAKLQAGKRTHRVTQVNTAVVKDLSELCCCLSPAMRGQMSLPTQINGIECAEVAVDGAAMGAEFVGSCGLEGLQGFGWIALAQGESSVQRG
jgi:hypothetical protein